MPASIPFIAEPNHARREAPAATEVALEMLAACHGRVQAQCELLQRLVEHTATRGVDDEARDAARGVMRYFELAAPHHHADEEQDLFPALLESMAGSDPVCLRELTAALTAEHRVLEGLWRTLHAALQALIADGAPLPAAPVDAFVAGYLAHVRREDEELFPMAARLLDDEALERVGRAMRLRRGIEQVD